MDTENLNQRIRQFNAQQKEGDVAPAFELIRSEETFSAPGVASTQSTWRNLTSLLKE